jgi:hypothetical protein
MVMVVNVEIVVVLVWIKEKNFLKKILFLMTVNLLFVGLPKLQLDSLY